MKIEGNDIRLGGSQPTMLCAIKGADGMGMFGLLFSASGYA